MKIISWNVNGLRSVYKKGFLEWLYKEDADIYCFQEIKAHESQLSFELTLPRGYKAIFNSAEKKGYSGVAVYSKKVPLRVNNKLGLDYFDKQGRILELEFEDFILINLYMPHGGRMKDKLVYKLASYKALLNKLANMYTKQIIISGDFNIAHKEVDLARPKQNQNNIMFTPEERAQIDELVGSGFIDSFRLLHKGGGYHSWWPYGLNARERNLGWRIDYIFLTKNIAQNLKRAFILSEIVGSDHCPVGIELD